MPSGVPYTHVYGRRNMKWTDGEQRPRTSKFKRRFELVRQAQENHPGKWANIATYDSQQVAADTASRLRKQYGEEFEIKSIREKDSQKGVVLARTRNSTTTDE